MLLWVLTAGEALSGVSRTSRLAVNSGGPGKAEGRQSPRREREEVRKHLRFTRLLINHVLPSRERDRQSWGHLSDLSSFHAFPSLAGRTDSRVSGTSLEGRPSAPPALRPLARSPGRTAVLEPQPQGQSGDGAALGQECGPSISRVPDGGGRRRAGRASGVEVVGSLLGSGSGSCATSGHRQPRGSRCVGSDVGFTLHLTVRL